MQPTQDALDPNETLFIKSRKRFIPVYKPDPRQPKELVLHCGMQEISFDEPDLFPWAEKLIEQDSFLASAATGWTSQPLDWERVQGLLEALIAEGILDRAPPEKAIGQLPPSELHLAFLEREAERPATTEPRWWSPDPGAVLRDLTGRELEPGYVETIVPVHRMAHIALDQEGRQVGEANSFPDRLRLKLETEYRTCNYAGSRYHDDLQMNMTALRSMLAHWAPVLRTVLLCRDEFVKRYPQPGGERWKLGEVHLLSSGILALPAFAMMRWKDPVKNGELDPVLSSLFRVTDGVRMVAAHMLDVPELRFTNDSLVLPSTITDLAESEEQYLSTKGVCAGPQNMIDELVETLMHGKPLAYPEPKLGAWAADIPSAVDYGLLGVQLYAATFSIWMKMGLAYTRIDEVLQRAPKEALGKLREAADRDLETVKKTRANLPLQQAWSEGFARRMFAHAQLGERGLLPADRKDLAQELTPPAGLLRNEGALRDLFASLEPAASIYLQEIAGHLLDFWRFERNALRLVTSVQRRINALLGRPQPAKPLTGNQVALHHVLRKGTVSALPPLHDALREALGIDVDNQIDSTRLTWRDRALILQ